MLSQRAYKPCATPSLCRWRLERTKPDEAGSSSASKNSFFTSFSLRFLSQVYTLFQTPLQSLSVVFVPRQFLIGWTRSGDVNALVVHVIYSDLSFRCTPISGSYRKTLIAPTLFSRCAVNIIVHLCSTGSNGFFVFQAEVKSMTIYLRSGGV